MMLLRVTNCLVFVFACLMCCTSQAEVQFKNEGNQTVELAVAFEHSGKWIKYGWNKIAPGETRRLNSSVRGTVLYFARDAESQREVGRNSDPFSGRRTALPNKSRFVTHWGNSEDGQTYEFRLLRNSHAQTVAIGQLEKTPTALQPPNISDHPTVGAQTPGRESIAFEWMLDADIAERTELQASSQSVTQNSSKVMSANRSLPKTSEKNASKPGTPVAAQNVPAPSSTKVLELAVEE